MKPGALTDLLRQVAAVPGTPEAEPAPLPPGAAVGRFEIVRELGRGGFGVVYEARDRELGRQVALKLVRHGSAVAEDGKVAREAEAIARLAHPNLITLYDVGRSDHGPYLVFELLRGKTLQERIDDGPMPLQEAVHVAVEVARGLAHAHAEGVVHRDLKPSNVFVTAKGQVKILDFGMAHAFGRRRLSGGTPAYMAPEQWEDEPEDERTDVFALGVMIHVMLSGEYPFPKGEGRWSAGVATAPRLELRGAAGLSELIARMLEKAPKGRPRDGAAVLAELTPVEDALRTKPADSSPPSHAKLRKTTLGDLLAELKRRRVFRVMVGYGIFAFAVLQVTERIMHGAGLPDWMLKAGLVALTIGFLVAVILAWVFDLTSRGVERTPSATGSGRASLSRGRLAALLVFIGLVATLPGVGWYEWKRASEHSSTEANPGTAPSIAVLPFADLSPSHDQQLLSEGVAEEILNGLTQVDGLRVIGRTTSFSYKGKDKNVADLGRELGVVTVLEGSVRTSGNRVRIVAQLVQVPDGSNLWTKTFERKLSDVFSIQDEISRAVVEALRIRLLPEKTMARGGGTSDPEALKQYLVGRDLFRSGSVEDAKRAVEAFERAVSLDPRFALAWAEVAEAAHFVESMAGEGVSLERRRRAMSAAERAVELAPGLPNGYVARAITRREFLYDWQASRADLERARGLGPGSAIVACSYGVSLLSMGEVAAGVLELERAASIDPLWVRAWTFLGVGRISAEDHVGAQVALARALEINPKADFARWWLVTDLIAAGKPAAALVEARKARLEWVRLAGESLAQHDLGHPRESQAALDEFVRRNALDSAYQVAEIHAWRGENDLAFEWLERARAQIDVGMFWIKTDPLFRKARGDQRFPAFLRRVNLPVDGDSAADAAQHPSGPSIAVLPFADMSEKHDQEYFADGVAEEILNALAQVKGLKVIGRTSSFSFKGKKEDLRSIGQQLGAGTLLEGSVRKQGSMLRITAQLIKAADGTRLWSQMFDRNEAKIFAVQDEIARAVVAALQVKLLSGQVPSVAASRPTTPEAYRLYLLGRQLEGRGTPEDIEAGGNALEEATRLDQKYVPARVWLALARYDLANIGPSDPARQKEPAFDLPRASADGLREAEAVIALAPDAAEGYWLRGYLRGAGRLYDWEGAVADCRRANSLSPGDVRIRLDYARILATLGRLPEALALAQEAAESDPLSTEVYRWVGVFQAASGSADLAAATLRHGLEVAPANAYLLRELGYAYVLLGRGEEALRVSERAPADWIRSMIQALAHHQLGRDAESRLATGRLIEMHRGGVVRPTYQIAEAYAWRGEKEPAFQWLELAFAERDGGMTYVRYDPLLRGIRSDPRYAALLRKMKLPVD